MKHLSVILLSLILFCDAGCKKSNTDNATDTYNNTSTETTPVRTALLSGQWKVTYFLNSGSNQTANFGEYKFTLNSNGLLTGANTLFSQNGNWTLNSDSGKTKLNIDFTSAPLFTELTGDWEITSRTSTKIVMQHVSGGSGQTNYLTTDKEAV